MDDIVCSLVYRPNNVSSCLPGIGYGRVPAGRAGRMALQG